MDALDLQQSDLDQCVGIAERERDQIAFRNAGFDHCRPAEETVAARPPCGLGAVAHLARQIDQRPPVFGREVRLARQRVDDVADPGSQVCREQEV